MRVHPARILGLPVLAHLVRAEPGIALDTAWQAPLGARVRGVTDTTGQELFDAAREARDESALAQLASELDAARTGELAVLGGLFDEGRYAEAALHVRRLMFLERFGDEVGEARETIETD